MQFKTDLSKIQYKPCGVVIKAGAKIPGNDDLFFRAKQSEIYDQYCSARTLLLNTENENALECFNISKDCEAKEETLIFLKAIMYESALNYYNIVVDLSWVLAYSCAESFCFSEGKPVPDQLKGIMQPKDARRAMEYFETKAPSPKPKGKNKDGTYVDNDYVDSPYEYFAALSDQFYEVACFIADFWKKHENDPTRKRYNQIKHRCKPLYTEIETFNTYNIYIENNNHIYKMASGISDVSERYSLAEAIEELRKYDDEKLFPYISKLEQMLYAIIKPSVAV